MPVVMLGALPDAYALAVLQGMHRQTDRQTEHGGTGRENLSVVARAQMKRKNRAPISTAKWAAVAARDGWNCVYCGCSVTHWRPDDSHLSTDDDGNYQLPAGYRWANLDHVTPWSAGGSDDVANLAMSCAQCNQRKRDKVNDWSAAQ